MYPAEIEGSEGDYVATFRDLPEAKGCGPTREKAIKKARKALDAALRHRMKEGEPLPPPSKAQIREILVTPFAEMAAKSLIVRTCQASGLKRADLARHLGLKKKALKKLLDPNHESSIAEIETALRGFGYELAVGCFSQRELQP
ncbi:type II toxin-antitoxin system HicB family antitoxin [Methyloligella halotolerans]|nr:hypothetical protein [Methyloligella halotolerans]